MAQAFRDFLQTTTASQLVEADRPLFSVPKTATVEETLAVLGDNKLLSVPVQDPDSPSGFCDFVDVLDIVSSLVSHCKDLNSVPVKVETFTQQPVIEVVNLSNKDPFITAPESECTLKLLDLFASGVHRIALTNDQGKIVNVVSQLDFIRFTVERIDLFKDIALKSIKELGLVNSWVLFVRKSERSLACYKKMVENSVSALCVVDEAGKLEAHFSASSLRGLSADTFRALRLPVEDFLTAQKIPVIKAYSCTGDDTFEVVLKQLFAHSNHRLWVENAAGFPVGVISLTDVCATLKEK